MKRKTCPEEEGIALFCSNLKMAMHQRGISQKEVAALSGLTEAQVSRYIRGRCEPGLRTAAERFLLTSPCWKGTAICNTIPEGECDEQI